MIVPITVAEDQAIGSTGGLVTMPTCSTGDLLLLVVAWRGTTTTLTFEDTPGYGWSKINEYGTTNIHVAAWWLLAPNDTPSRPRVTFSAATSYLVSTLNLRAHDLVTPLDSTGDAIGGASSLSVPGFTASQAPVVSVAAVARGNINILIPTGYTTLTGNNYNGTSTEDISLSVSGLLHTDVDVEGFTQANSYWTAILHFGLRPRAVADSGVAGSWMLDTTDDSFATTAGLFPLTVEFWMRAAKAPVNKTLVQLWDGTHANTVYLDSSSIRHITNNPVLNPTWGEWYHIAIACDTTSTRIYINGELWRTDAAGSTYAIGAAATVSVGTNLGLGTEVDLFRVWNHARTVEQIQANMEVDTPADTTGLVHDLQFFGGDSYSNVTFTGGQCLVGGQTFAAPTLTAEALPAAVSTSAPAPGWSFSTLMVTASPAGRTEDTPDPNWGWSPLLVAALPAARSTFVPAPPVPSGDLIARAIAAVRAVATPEPLWYFGALEVPASPAGRATAALGPVLKTMVAVLPAGRATAAVGPRIPLAPIGGTALPASRTTGVPAPVGKLVGINLSDVKWYWDALTGIEPLIGGAPTFTRNQAATFIGRNGRTVTALRNTPRLEVTSGVYTDRPAAQLLLDSTETVQWDISLVPASNFAVYGAYRVWGIPGAYPQTIMDFGGAYKLERTSSSAYRATVGGTVVTPASKTMGTDTIVRFVLFYDGTVVRYSYQYGTDAPAQVSTPKTGTTGRSHHALILPPPSKFISLKVVNASALSADLTDPAAVIAELEQLLMIPGMGLVK